MKKIPAKCPHCEGIYNVESSHLGKKGKCKYCNEIFTIDEYVAPNSLLDDFATYEKENDDIIAPAVVPPPYPKMNNVNQDKTRVGTSRRRSSTDPSPAPSYWALRAVVTFVNFCGGIVIVFAIGFLIFATTKTNNSEKEGKEIAKEMKSIENRQPQIKTEFDAAVERSDEELMTQLFEEAEALEDRYVELSLKKEELDSSGFKYAFFMSLAAAMYGVIIIGLGQLLACVRDIAINSYCWQNM